jgi:hypothetical protein
VFLPNMPLLPGLMFVGKATLGYSVPSLPNIRPNRNGRPEINVVAYSASLSMMREKMFLQHRYLKSML